MNRLVWATATVLSLASAAAAGDLSVPDVFADHMVVQRDVPVRLWGRDVAGRHVRASVEGEAAIDATANAAGEWTATLPPMPAGGPHVIRLSDGAESVALTDVLSGDVWVAAGQSNMAYRMAPQLPWTTGVVDFERELAGATDPLVRVYTVVPESSLQPEGESHGLWQATTPAAARDFTAVGFYFARAVTRATGVPVGVLSASVGSTSITAWMDADAVGRAEVDRAAAKLAAAGGDARYRRSLPAYRAGVRAALPLDKPWPPTAQPYPGYPFQPTGFYNGMVAPLQRLPVKGVIWYQGEADADHAADYPGRFARFADQWRRQWGEPTLPIYFVQLPNFAPALERANGHPKPGADKLAGTWADMRAAQAECQRVPHTAMAVTIDVGSADMIHPPDKKTVGDRLALLALRDTYHKPTVASAPAVVGATADGPRVRLTFDGPLRQANGPVGGVEVAAADGAFHPAHVEADGPDRLVLTAAGVPSPTAVRYAWSDAPTATLFSPAGLPVGPFRIDVHP